MRIANRPGDYWFRWIPTKADIGRIYQMTFRQKGEVRAYPHALAAVRNHYPYDIEQDLRIHVRSSGSSVLVTPLEESETGLTYQTWLDVPVGAEIHEIGIVNSLTGEPINTDPFPGQSITNIVAGPLGGGENKHGVSFKLNNDSPQAQELTSVSFWVYVDYVEERYAGNP